MKMLKAKSLLLAALLSGAIAFGQGVGDGVKLLKYEKYESAAKVFSANATDNMANYYLGLAQLGQGNVEAAKATFQKFPEDKANQVGLARVYLTEGKSAEAMTLLNTVVGKIKKKETDIYKLAADAITYTDGGDITKAIEWYNLALKASRSTDVLIGLGDAYRKTPGGGGNAMNNYEEATSMDPNNSLAFSRIGSLWYAAKNFNAALEAYGKAQAADPNNPIPYSDLADAYYRVNKYDKAKENIEKYLQLSDNSIDDQIRYANILFLSQDYPAAISKMQELLNKGVDKPYMYRLLAYSKYETGDATGAMTDIQQFFAKQPSTKVLPSDYMYYARILDKNNQADLAKVQYLKALDADTSADKSEVIREIADQFRKNKDFKSAAEWYGMILSKHNASAKALDLYYKGFSEYYSQQYDAAIGTFKQFTEKYNVEPSNIATGQYWLALAQAAKDPDAKTGTAVDAFTKYIEVTKDDASKKDGLMKAYQYLAVFNYNKKDKATALAYCDKILALDATNATAKQIKDLLAKSK